MSTKLKALLFTAMVYTIMVLPALATPLTGGKLGFAKIYNNALKARTVI